jgi:putative FmdB family regulatory protein
VPTYQYKCTDGGKKEEVVRGMAQSEAPPPLCPGCNSDMKKNYSAGSFGIQFNGSGFYSKDK